MKILNKIILALLVTAVISGISLTVFNFSEPEEGNNYACTLEAKICPDGSAVGRSGPSCEFAECPAVEASETLDKSDLIIVTSPQSGELVSSPLAITGKARGYWFFEASFPVMLVDDGGNVVASGVASATDSWMTEEFVGFEAELSFVVPDSMDKGVLILKKDNPSGLPENDDSLEISVVF